MTGDEGAPHDFVGRSQDRARLHEGRADLLEAVVDLEQAAWRALASRLGKDELARILLEQAFARLPTNALRRLLADYLDVSKAGERYPVLLEEWDKVFETRNLAAHGQLLEYLPASDADGGDQVVLETLRHGRRTTTALSARRFAQAAVLSQAATATLREIEGARR